MKLITPSLKYKQAYMDALVDSKHERSITILEKPAEKESFADFVKRLKDNVYGLSLPPGYVPASTFWLIVGEEVIGRLQIRHELNEHLLKYGGHIGYYIKPSKRRMGYGKEALSLGLIEAGKLGLKKVLVTCDETNIGSRKIIEANGGVLENIIEGESAGQPSKMRYWIQV